MKTTHRPRLAAAVLAVAAMLLGACAALVPGRLVAHSAPHARLGALGADNGTVDTQAQNALSDIEAFWRTAFPTVSGGTQLTPLRGGYFSVDGRAIAISGSVTGPARKNRCLAKSKDAGVDNAFYCRLDDSIAWDRSPTHLLGALADKYGPLLVGLIFAHEFGHSISNRLGVFKDPPATIYTESQADCAAGAWAEWVLQGRAPHYVGVTTADLDRAFDGYLNARDETPDTEQDVSHGNGFDRLSALADGLNRGVTYCFSGSYFQSRTFTERPYTTDQDLLDGGNQPLEQLLDSDGAGLVADLNRFWSAAAGSAGWTALQLRQAGSPPCASDQLRLGYCAAQHAVYLDPAFARSVYYSLPETTVDKRTGDVQLSDTGAADFAVGELLAVQWGLAHLAATGTADLSGRGALLSAICGSGAYAKDINPPVGRTGADVFALSPADLDEAVSALLKQAGTAATFGARGTSGLDRIQAFVTGYGHGLSRC